MKKQQVFYIHGGESFLDRNLFLNHLKGKGIWDLPSEDNVKKWTSSLREDLGNDYEVFMPAMPNKQNAHYDEWQIWFERHFEYLHDEVILIGHSLGAMFLAKYVSENSLPFSVKALFLLAGAYKLPDFNDPSCGNFLIEPAVVAEGLVGKVHKVVIVHSEDDFCVPFAHGEALAAALSEAEFITYMDKNHFLIEEFPELLDKIRGC